MSEKEIKTVKTSRGELRYYRDWDKYEGGVIMLNPQTIARYREIKEGHPCIENYGCFFAFGQEQFNENLAVAISAGRIKEGEKIYSHPAGLYGTREGITAYLAWYEERDKAIPAECDPQEVYFYEYNNYECMYDWDGDINAVKAVIGHFGVDAARALAVRFNAVDIDKVLTRDK